MVHREWQRRESEWGMGEKKEGQRGGWGREILLCAAAGVGGYHGDGGKTGWDGMEERLTS